MQWRSADFHSSSRLKADEHSSAQRAADGSPRREPWGIVSRFSISPEGDTSKVHRKYRPPG